MRRKKIDWNQIVQALVLVRIGQDLGTHTPLAKSIHDIIDNLATFLSALTKLL